MVFSSVVRHMSKRVPMIKFRAGQPAHKSGSGASGSSAASHVRKTVSQGQAIEDYQLPPRYRRRPIDESEIEMINSGFSLK